MTCRLKKKKNFDLLIGRVAEILGPSRGGGDQLMLGGIWKRGKKDKNVREARLREKESRRVK